METSPKLPNCPDFGPKMQCPIQVLEELRLEKNRLTREKRKELKEKLSISIDINADTEISEYELVREKNIRELEEAKKNSCWFSDQGGLNNVSMHMCK